MAKRSARKPARRISLRDLTSAAPIVLLATVALALAVQVSVAGEFRGSAPQLALRFVPVDAEARAKLASALASNNPLLAARQAARALAHDAILRDPIAPVAMRALGAARAMDGSSDQDQDEAAKLFREAERLSRRDQLTQLWLAEHHLRRDQVPEALRHFDTALRTSSTGQDTLFSLLAFASSDHRVADAVIARMREKPHWAMDFASFLTGGQAPPEPAGYILRNTLDPSIPDEMALIEAMMQRFAATGEYRLAAELHDHFKLARNTGSNLVNDGGFDTGKGVQPFAWSLVEEADLWSAPELQTGRGKVLVVSASGGRSGDVARQLLQLPAGAYRVSAKFGNVPSDGFNRPKVRVSCAESPDTDLAALVPTRAGSNGERVEQTISVPGSCSFQWIAVAIAGSETGGADLPWVDDVSIAHAGR